MRLGGYRSRGLRISAVHSSFLSHMLGPVFGRVLVWVEHRFCLVLKTCPWNALALSCHYRRQLQTRTHYEGLGQSDRVRDQSTVLKTLRKAVLRLQELTSYGRCRHRLGSPWSDKVV
jgi:hypothetical protein